MNQVQSAYANSGNNQYQPDDFPHPRQQQSRFSSSGAPPSFSPGPQSGQATYQTGQSTAMGHDQRVRNPSQQPQQAQSPPPRSAPYSPPSAQSHNSPAPSYSGQSHRPGSSSAPTTRPTSILPSQGSTRSLASHAQPGGMPGGGTGAPTIAGEPLHDLGRAVALLKSSKFYAEGFLMKRVEAGADGKSVNGPDGQWAKWFVQLSGTIMSTWNAAEMEEAAKHNNTVPPQYLNLQDAFLHPFPPHARGPKTPTQFQFALNSAGANRILFCAPTLQSLTMWINAIRLSAWERSRCNEIYTGSLLGLREPRGVGWQGYDAGLPAPGSTLGGHVKHTGRFEGWIKARLPGDTEWRRVWTVVQRGSNVPTRASLTGGPAPVNTAAEEKRSRRSSLLSFGKKGGKDKHDAEAVIEDLPGEGAVSTVAFWERKPAGGKKAEPPLCIAQHVFYAAALFPEAEPLIDFSTLFKIEGTFLNPVDGFKTGWGVGGRAEKQGWALLMLEEGGAMDMLHWIVALSDAFKLYGRPRDFSYDPRDPSSLYFALPVGPHRDRQFLDRELVDNFDINESRPRAIRAIFHNQLFERMRMPRGTQPPPAETRETSSQNGSGPASPLDSSDSSRRWSQVPQSPARDETPRLPPVLPPIGEGSIAEEAQSPATAVTNDFPPSQNAATPVESQGIDIRRMSIHRQTTVDRRNSLYGAPPPPTEAQNGYAAQAGPSAPPPATTTVPNNYLGDIGLKRRSQGGSAENDLSAYTDFLSSDIARERTPPPPVPAIQQQPRSPYSSSPYVDSPRLNPINTTSPPLGSASAASPVQQTPASSNFAKPLSPHSHAGASDLTHLTYAVPGANNQQAFDQHVVPPHHGSPTYSPSGGNPQQRLPSPGAASALETPQEPIRSPHSPGLPYLSGSPAHHQQGFANGQSTVTSPVSPIQHQQREHFATPLSSQPLPAALAPPSGHERPASPLEAETARSVKSDRSLGTSVSQMHNGRVVDSPEILPVELPKEGDAFTTEPLFGGAGSPRPTQGPQHSTMSALEEPKPKSAALERTETLRSESEVQQRSTGKDGTGIPEDYNIHQDLLAALNFVDRTSSDDLEHSASTPASPSSVEPSPMPHQQHFHVGPPKHGKFGPPSPADEEYGFQAPPIPPIPRVEPPSDETGNKSSARTSASSTPAQQSFPSSFAKNKRDERAAAAQVAQQTKEAALTRPGRAAGQQQKKKVWVDSDEEEDEEEEEEEESSDDEPPTRSIQPSSSSASFAPSPINGSRGPSPQPPMSSSQELPPPPVPHFQQQQRSGQSPQRPVNVDAAARQSYLDYGPGHQNYSNSAPPASPTRDAYQPAPTEGQAPRKLALNPHGLLATGMLEREERSARAQEHAARDVGNTLINLPAKPLPPQTGLVGALTSHQREKERTGGVGRALTDQQRERKLAEQRQKQLDDMQRQQLAMYQQQQQMQMAQFGGGFGGMGMGSMGFAGSNPWMMGGMGMMPGMGGFGGFPGGGGGSQIGMPAQSPTPLQPQGTGNGMDQAAAMHQQQQMMAAQFAAQQAAQQAYLSAMQQFSPPATSSPPGGSPSLSPSGYPSMSSMPSMPFMPSAPYGGFPGPSSQMAGSPSFGPTAFGGFGHVQQPSMYAGSQFSFPQQQQHPQDNQIHTVNNSAGNSDDEAARAMSPLDLKAGRREGTEH